MEKKVQITVAFKSSRKPTPDETVDDEDEDEDDDDDFDFSTSGLKTKLPDKRIVEMKVLNTGATVHVKCRLPWTWSWLQATIELRYPVGPGKSSEVQQLIDGKFKVIQCHLDPSQGHNGVTAIGLFLKDVASCSDGDKNSSNEEVGKHFTEYKTQFCTWLGHLPSRSVTLAQLEQLMNQYEEEAVSRNNVQVSLFRQHMSSSVAGQVFCMATNQPTFFRAAPILFPRKILSLMVFPSDDHVQVRKKQKLLEILETVALEDPWKFGFSEVMYKETHASGLEAPLFAMRSAWFFPSLSDLHKTALQTYDMFKAECKSKGHTFLLHNNLPLHFSFYCRDRERRTKEEEIGPPSNTETYSAVEFLIEHEILRREVRGAEERFHLMRYWKAEEGIVTALEQVMLSLDWVLEVDLSQERFSRIQGDASQMVAARSIVNKPVTMISGRGGTGKTEVVSAVLKVAEESIKDDKRDQSNKDADNSLISEDGVNSEDSFMTADNRAHNSSRVTEDSSNGPILYCAPTGKAASVIKKRVGSKAFTIHQVLASYKLWRNGEMSNPWKFGATRIVAVDECSMVSIEIFHFLLKYLMEGAELGKVVLLGDHLQLPSVDPGNFMEDLFDALKPRGYTVELTTNHRSEGSIIFSNATKISKQEMPCFDADQGFRLIIPEKDSLNSVPRSARAGCSKLGFASAQLLQTVKGRGRDPEQDKLELYWSLLRQHRQKFSIEDDEKSQIISFLNNECYALNQFGCFVYNKHLMFSSEGRRMRKQFDVGDKIMCTKNSDIPIFVDENSEKVDDADDPVVQNDTDSDVSVTIATDGNYKEPPGLKLKSKNERLMNGNLYKIRALCRANVSSTVSRDDKNVTVAEKADDGADGGETVSVSREYYVLDDLAGDIIRANPEMLQKKTKISHAWALSIHKFQGSEAETIVYGLSGSNYESWKHVYTAVTRGRKDVVIVGSYQDLENAVKKKPIKRQTALTEKVRKMYSGLAKKREERKKAAEEESIPEDVPDNGAKKGKIKNKKIEKGVKKDRKSEDVNLSPTKKLSQILENSLSLDWGPQEDSLFKEVCEARAGRDSDSDMDNDTVLSRDLTDISPNKRRSDWGDGTHFPHKQVRNLSQKGWGLDETAFSFQSPLASLKRQASDSPASYQRSCVVQSPATYQVSRTQPGGEVEQVSRTHPVGEVELLQDSFIDLDCSQLEREAIASSQRDFCRNMMNNVFGSDDDDDEHAEFEELFEKTEKDDYEKQTNC